MAHQPPTAGKQGPLKGKQGPPKLTLSSDSSSSEDLSAKWGSHTEKPTAPTRKTPTRAGGPPPPPAKEALLSSLYSPSSPHTVPDESRAKPAWSSADPLLAVDPHPAAVQRIKSAVLVRGSSARHEKASHQKGISGGRVPKDHQILDRSASKRASSRSGAPSGALNEFAPPKEKGNDRLERLQSAKQDNLVRGSPDVWNSPVELAPPEAMKLETGKVQASRRQSGMLTAGKKPSAAGDFAYGERKSFSKQLAKAPSSRGGHIDGEGRLSFSPSLSGNVTQKLPSKQPSFGGRDTPVVSRGEPGGDRGLVQELETLITQSNKRVAELEALLRDTTKSHKAEIDRERSEHRFRLEEEIKKAKLEHDEAVERIRKEAESKLRERTAEDDARIAEVKREALARQNSMKMHCAASVSELKAQVASLERQLKAKSEEFENEKRVLIKSFEDRRKSDFEAAERKAQAHHEELKSKELELQQQSGRVQALTASVQTLTTSLSQMKELNDVSRTATQALEEKSKAQAAYIKTLMKREENLKAQVTKLMPIKEAKRLAFRALLKGRAVEMISRACASTDAGLWDKAWALQQFIHLIGGSRGSNEKRQDAIESRLMQFRKEQMFLMAENERLMAKVSGRDATHLVKPDRAGVEMSSSFACC